MRTFIKNELKVVLSGLLLSAPLVSFADERVTNPPANANALLNSIGTYIINPIIYVLFAAAFVVFLWGLVQFVAHLDNEEARSTGGKHMLWGIIGMAVMVGVTGVVNIIRNTIAQLGG